MKNKEILLFFTLQYPYGQKSETFIENEIGILATEFKHIIIFPRERDGEFIRPLPGNVEVNDLLVNRTAVINYKKFFFKHPFALLKAIQVYLYTLIVDKNRISYLRNGYFIYYLANAIKDSIVVKNFLLKNNLQDAVFYDYWFVNSTLSLALLKASGHINNFISRAHGFDVFDDRWKCGSVPFRQFIVTHCNYIAPVSNYNREYIISRLNTHKNKVHTHYLGVQDKASNLPAKKNATEEEKSQFLLVSCANLFPFKQIHRIPEVLKELASKVPNPIKWVHFGNGPCETDLMEKAAELPSNVEFTYFGHVQNQEVLKYYQQHQVNLFLSLSLKEGLPVSMMEAQSFGIPIMAYNIYGIPEIVNDKTGILLDTQMKDSEIGNLIIEIIEGIHYFNKKEIRNHYLEKFQAKKNYTRFVNKLINT
jgi:glycosyltransferase involved in cell wall biosynthesis